MNNDKTLYEILGFSKNGYNEHGEKVSFESIERAKNRLLYGDGIEGAVPFWLHSDINRAYDVLSNPTSRREYDESLLIHDVSYSSNDTSVTEEPVVVEPINEEQLIVTPQEERTVDEINEEEYDEAVVDLDDYYSNTGLKPEEVTPEEVTPEEVTPEEVTPEEVTPEEVTPEEVIPEEVTPEEVTPEEVIPEEETPKIDIIPIAEKEKKEKKEKKAETEKPKKELSKFKKALIYGSSFVVLGIPGPIVAYLAIKKLSGKKLKLHPNKNKKVSEIKTEEARLIEEYNDKINKEINALLARPNNNYNLHILKTRYENQVELLKKRIDLKMNEKVTGKNLLKYKLEYVALNNQLKRAEAKLKESKEKIESYENEGKKKNLLSNALNEKLYKTSAEVKNAEKDSKSILIKKLNVRKNRWQKARDFSVKGLKLTRGAVGKVQDGVIRAWDNVRSIKEIFTPYDKIHSYTEEEIPKTR